MVIGNQFGNHTRTWLQIAGRQASEASSKMITLLQYCAASCILTFDWKTATQKTGHLW